MGSSGSRTFELRLRGECALSCPHCDCRDPAMSPSEIRRRLEPGGTSLTLRGASETSPDLEEVVRAARESVPVVVLRTNGLRFREPAAARRLVELGVTGVVVPLFSHAQRVHDRIASHDGALVGALVGMRALAEAGLEVSVEIPILSPRLQDLPATIDLARRAVPTLAGVRLFVPDGPVPTAVAPPPWSAVAGAMARVVSDCDDRDIRLEITPSDGIPFCALADHREAWPAFRFHPHREVERRPDAPLACRTCAVRRQCRGPTRAYSAANGERDIRPFDVRPRELYDQRTGQLRVWTDAERRAARETSLLVVRPTVHCNQDCSFCSANETTKNVWPDSDRMKRVIARAAQRGVRRISFSGGEPLLSKDLVDYVEIASRAGIGEVELVTNAVLLARGERAAALRQAGLTHAFVSLHAHDEMLSRAMTNKVGDFARTVAGLHQLVDQGVTTVVNHVIAERNYRFLPQFVEWLHAELGGRVGLSLAFVTPQFKALENIDLVPRISDAMPFLRAAMNRALELGQPFWVGSRQGIPPCILGEHAPWSDVLHLAEEAASEDASQKIRAEGCGRCLYGGVCQGLWRPYAARFGLDELEPVGERPLEAEERAAIAAELRARPWGAPTSFEDAPARLRRPELERRAAASVTPAAPPVPVVEERELAHHRPLRFVVAGSASRGRLFGRAIAAADGVDVAAVASPHAPDIDLTADFGDRPTYREVVAALEGTDPDGLIVATATHAHDAIVREAIRSGVPVLCEKPLTNRLTTTRELVELAAENRVMLAAVHNLVHAPGIERLASLTPEHVRVIRRFAPQSPDLPRAWSPVALFESMYHSVAMAVGLAGRAALSGAEIVGVAHAGEARPERVSFTLRGPSATAEIRWELARADETEVEVARGDERLTWRRAGPVLTVDDGDGPRPVERRGSEIERMVADFRDAIVDGSSPRATGEDALVVTQLTRDVVHALEDAGAPLDRSETPRHASSRELSAFDLRR